MSDGRNHRVIDAKPGEHIEGVLLTPAKLVVSEYDHGVADYSVAELQSIAARLDKAGRAVRLEPEPRQDLTSSPNLSRNVTRRKP